MPLPPCEFPQLRATATHLQEATVLSQARRGVRVVTVICVHLGLAFSSGKESFKVENSSGKKFVTSGKEYVSGI